MKYIYDAKTDAFYPVESKESYFAKGLWPESGVGIDEETFAEFQAPPPGKVRVAGADGYPAWADIPPPTFDQLVQLAEDKKQQLIDEASSVTADWRTELALGIIDAGDKVKLTDWMKYIKMVKTVETSTVPEIIWPVKPEK